MLANVLSAAIVGVDAHLVDVEVDISAGLPQFSIVGLPDTRWGEVVCAALVVEEGCEVPSVEALRGWLEGKLTPFKHPRRAIAVDSLPRTPATGQIQRSQVRDRILNLDA